MKYYTEIVLNDDYMKAYCHGCHDLIDEVEIFQGSKDYIICEKCGFIIADSE